MRAIPERLEGSTVVRALRDGWDFDAAVAEYAAVGAGSYHWQVRDATGRRGFVTVDDLDQKAWLGDTRVAAFDGLRRAFDIAVALRGSGLRFVVAPIPSRGGASVRRLDSRHAIALFPFVAGEAGEYGRYAGDDRQAIVAMLAELHRAPASLAAAAPAAGLTIPGRRHLEAALLELDETWTGGPLAERARDAVRDAASDLTALLGLADRLAAAAARRGGGSVVTHGEPHAANVLRTSEGRVLVDWDTVALAPPERDLWMLTVEGMDAAELYARASGRQLDRAALDFFRLTWELKDLAEYLNVLRAPHEENDDTVRQYGALTRCGAIREEWTALLPMRRGSRKADPFSIRLPAEDDRFVKDEARRLKRSRGAIVEGYASEAIRMRRYPGIAFRGEDYNRRAWVLGSGLDVWEVVALVRDFGSQPELGAEYGLTAAQIKVSLAYHREFADEIDDLVARGRRSEEELHRAYPFIQTFEEAVADGER